jgi:hypothetical protein
MPRGAEKLSETLSTASETRWAVRGRQRDFRDDARYSGPV